jgi:hypothetical protein
MIKDTHAAITDLELLCSDLEDDLVELQGLLGPWYPSRIPHEILCEIFLYAAEHSPKRPPFPWTAMAVCRAWRRAAIGCPGLWATLHVVCHAAPLNEMTRDHCRRFVFKDLLLSTPVAIRKAIRRSRGGLLNVSLLTDIFGPGPDFCQDCFTRCLAQVGQQGERWRSFSFAARKPTQFKLGPLFASSFPNLHSVLLSGYSPDLLGALASHAPLLHTIAFRIPHDFTPYIAQAIWPRIRKLDLGCAWVGQHDNLGQLLAACTALRSLELSDVYYGPIPSNSLANLGRPPLPDLMRMKCRLRLSTWASLSGMTLTVLYIAGLDVLSSLDPNDRNLSTWNSDDLFTNRMSKINLPKLKHLTCEGAPTLLCATALFDAPSLVDLVVISLLSSCRGHNNREHHDRMWTNVNVSFRPRNVVLHWQPGSVFQCFISLFRSLRDIRRLTLRGIPLDDASVFVQPQTLKLCRGLEGITWWLISDTEGAEELLNRFHHAARECFGGPQTQWVVERISRAEDDRTFFNVRLFLIQKLCTN